MPQCSNRRGRVFNGEMKEIKRGKSNTKKGIIWQYDVESKNTEKEPQLAAGFSCVALEDETFTGPLEDGGDKISNSDSEMAT